MRKLVKGLGRALGFALLWAAASANPGFAAGPEPLPSSASATRIRVLFLNIYGRNENDCRARYREIARRIRTASPAYDIVSLNEHWRLSFGNPWICDADVLTDAILEDPRYRNAPGKLRRLLTLPEAPDVTQIDADNSVFTLHEITHSYSSHYVNNFDVEATGFLATSIKLSSRLTLDLWTTHLSAGSDGCDQDCRWEQASDLSLAMMDYSGSPELKGRGNPVLLAGDFNIGGPLSAVELGMHLSDPEEHKIPGNPGYLQLMETLGNPMDLWLYTHPLGGFGANAGTTRDCVTNSVLKGSCKYRERIDYLFAFGNGDIQDSRYRIVPRKVDVVRWKTPAGGDVSDHFGLEATLDIF